MRALPINDVVPGVTVEGPVPELAAHVRELHRRFHRSAGPANTEG
ncbi:cytosine/adenosine deaminase [Streptomyces sp. L-9-10]|nr:cytosine/adenosine deaminase [Streptomyces sp. L-9-10]